MVEARAGWLVDLLVGKNPRPRLPATVGIGRSQSHQAIPEVLLTVGSWWSSGDEDWGVHVQ